MTTNVQHTTLKDFLQQEGRAALLVHNAKQVEKVVLLKDLLNKEYHIIVPTSVEAIFALDKAKLSYHILEDNYTESEAWDFVLEMEKRTEVMVEEIDRVVAELCPEIRKNDLEMATFQLFCFIRVFGSLNDAYFKLKNFFQKQTFSRISFFVEQENGVPAKQIESGRLFWHSNENLFAKILNVYKTPIQVSQFASIGSNAPVMSKKQSILKKIQRNPRLFYLFKILKRRGFAAMFKSLHCKKLNKLLLLNAEYNWKFCVDELLDNDCCIWGQVNEQLGTWKTEKTHFSLPFGEIIKKLSASDRFMRVFQQSDIDFYPLMEEKIVFFLKYTIPSAFNVFRKVSNLIRAKKLKGLLFSINYSAVSKSICMAFRKAGLPVIGWQHGGTVAEQMNYSFHSELSTSDLFLTWGESSKKHRLNLVAKLSPKPDLVVAGSVRLERIKESSATDKQKILQKAGIPNKQGPIIVYITTMYYGPNLTSPSPPPRSDNYLYQTQKTIINGLAKQKGVKIIKLFPNLFYALPVLEEYCRTFKDKDVLTVRNEATATELFSIADVIIIDFPNTVIVEAVAFSKPICCLTKHFKLEKESLELLSKRAVLADTADELMAEVAFFLESGQYKADINNNEFLKAFAVADGQSAKRAAIAVKNLVKKFESGMTSQK